MVKRDIKTLSVLLPDGRLYESKTPIGFLSSMIQNELCASIDAEDGKIALPDSCEFIAEVELSDTDLAQKYIYLEVSGILAKGELFFNEKSCGVLNGPHRQYLFDVADKSVAGKNTVKIVCNEPVIPKHHLLSDGERSQEYDTAMRVADFAVLNPLTIYISDSAFISNVKMRQEHVDGKVSVFVNAETIGESDDVRIVASLAAPSGKIYFGGSYEKDIKISVADPELWWPRGYGAQPIYKLTVTLYHGADVADVYEKRIGLRTIELSNDENTATVLKVNGIKVFLRGATYVKQNAVCTSVTKEAISSLFASIMGANMNTLTVFDETIPLPDAFYDLADKFGLLVLQSVTIPYIAPPAAGVFASGVTDSVRDSVKRLYSHPSVSMFFLSFAATGEDMMRLFGDSINEFRGVSIKILGPVLSEYAPNTPFLTDFDDVLKYDERYLGENNSGYAYKTLYALPSEYTLKSYLDEDNYNIFSSASEKRTSVCECVKMIENTVKHMKMPNGMSELVYASELAAGYELSKSIKRARREGNCYSSVLRQLNDGKKTVSSSFIDYFGKPKATLKFVSSAYAPVCLDVVPCVDETVFYLINSTKKDFVGKLVYALYDMSGKCLEERRIDVNTPSAESIVCEKTNFSRSIGTDPASYYVSYELYDEKGIVCAGSEHFAPLKFVKFNDPKIEASISGMGKKFSVKLSSTSYAYAVKVDFEDLNVNFSDNFVNLYGKTPVVINFETSEVVTLSELEKRLKIYTPYSVGR